jgi:hypothetical protein
MNLNARLATLPLALVPLAAASSPAASRDGRLFDPGVTMDARAPGAPGELDRAAFLVGSWDVVVTRPGAEGEASESRGQAEITWMNRGHGLMERSRTLDQGGGALERSRIAAWNWGEASSFEECVTLHHGNFEGEALIVRDGGRPRGGQQVVITRRTLRRSEAGFAVEDERSTDLGATWTRSSLRTYARRSEPAGMLATGEGVGEAAPGLPEAAHQFDFLLGEYDAAHDLTLPNGRNVKFPSVTTAVRVLNGHAILEFDRVDVDPQLPDAATSIVRIYNRAMRRWESLYVINRGNAQLHFGGVQEGDRIVLTLFGAHRGDAPFSYFVFHDVRAGGYRWYSERSNDHGATFEKYWTIDVTPRGDAVS